MTMIKVERVEDLPDWFCLEKYNNSENFRAIDWLRSLAIRSEILHIMNHKPSNEHGVGVLSELMLREMNEAISILRNSPLERSMPAHSNYWEHINNEIYLIEKKPVLPLTFGDLIEECNSDRQFKPADSVEKWDVLADSDTHRSIKRKDIAAIPVEFNWGNPNSVVAITVDMNFPDTIIEATFTKWLETERAKSRTTATKYRKPTHDRWTRYGVLPYLDLTIWAQETGASIPDRVMTAAITSLTDIGDDRLRKTVAPLADSLMADLSDLEALAILENRTPPTLR
jgi:hypothetical protein